MASPELHNSEGYESLADGQAVEFETATGPKGLQATGVKVS